MIRPNRSSSLGGDSGQPTRARNQLTNHTRVRFYVKYTIDTSLVTYIHTDTYI